MSARLELHHTGQLPEATLIAIRQMLEVAYDGEFAPEDWGHTLGGMHALAWDGAELIGHAAVVQRQLLHRAPEQPARTLRAGYIEGVAVRADRRRCGVGSALMAALEEIVRRAYTLGALSASDEARAMYLGRGWLPWRGRTFAMTPDGMVRTAEEDAGIMVLTNAPIELTGDLVCDWRDGDVW